MVKNKKYPCGYDIECKECVANLARKRRDSKRWHWNPRILPKKMWFVYESGYKCTKVKLYVCKVCGVEFKSKNKKTICGDECAAEQHREYQRAKHKENPWLLRERKYRRKLRETRQDDGTVVTGTYNKLLNDNKICLYCGETLTNRNSVIDHMDPLSKGGLHSITNLIPCCKTCNMAKAAKDFIEYIACLNEPYQSNAWDTYWSKKLKN